MRSFALLLGALAALAGAARAADSSDPATLMTTRGKLLFSDDFQKLSSDWKAGKGEWKAEGGTLTGKELPEDKHGAVLRHALGQENVVIQYAFKFDGAKGSTLSINDAKEHVCRVVLGPSFFRAQKDDHDHDGPDKAAPFNTVKTKPGDGWHTLVVEILAAEMVARLDGGGPVSFGSDELIGAKKANFGLTVAGQSMQFRDLKVWEAAPNSNWGAEKAKLTAAEPAKNSVAK